MASSSRIVDSRVVERVLRPRVRAEAAHEHLEHRCMPPIARHVHGRAPQKIVRVRIGSCLAKRLHCRQPPLPRAAALALGGDYALLKAAQRPMTHWLRQQRMAEAKETHAAPAMQPSAGACARRDLGR